MTIGDVTAHGLSSLIEPPRQYQFRGGPREIRKRDVILVTVETSTGEIGVAPCGTGAFMKWEEFNEAAHDDIAAVINEIVSPELVGLEIDDIETVRAAISDTNLPEYLQWQAQSVIDIALFDILGKRRGAPVYELLDYGTEPTEEIDLYASSGLYLSPDEYAEEAKTLIDQGYAGYKYRAGLGPEADRRAIRSIRDAVGTDVNIMVDAHAWWSIDEPAYTREEIESLTAYMGEHDIHWVEEPVPPGDYERYRWLTETTGVPLAGGENEDTPGSLVNLAELGKLQYLQYDVKQHGGFTGCRQAIEFCESNGVSYVPHNYGTDLGVVANAHLAAAVPKCEFLEFPIYETNGSVGMYPFPLANAILSTDLKIEDGSLTVPSGPGLGVDVNLDVIEEYAYVDGPWSTSV